MILFIKLSGVLNEFLKKESWKYHKIMLKDYEGLSE